MIPNGVVTWAEIDLDAIAHNIQSIRQYVGSDTEIIASVKANAYGHGLRPVARTALAAGADRLAVHRIQAAIALPAAYKMHKPHFSSEHPTGGTAWPQVIIQQNFAPIVCAA